MTALDQRSQEQRAGEAQTRAIVADALVEYYGRERAQQILDQVAARYQGPIELAAFVQITLREASRLKHGDTTGWDAASRATGFDPVFYERPRPLTTASPAEGGDPHGSRR